ncbi:hypothetical protein M9458_029157, partial [Cirrhinus mrigala]
HLKLKFQLSKPLQGADSQFESDAKMAAVLKRAAKEGLNNRHLGNDLYIRSSACSPEVHGKLMKTQKARFLARTRYTNSSSFTTLDGGPTRGFTEVPQTEGQLRCTPRKMPVLHECTFTKVTEAALAPQGSGRMHSQTG